MNSAGQSWPEGQSWSKDYPENWRNLATARKLFYGIMVYVLACWILSRVTGNELLIRLSGLSPFILFFVWMPLGMLIRRWKCPRCRLPFSDSGFCESCLAALQPDLGRAFFGYTASLMGRLTRDLELNPPENQPENRYVTDYCSHCRLPRY